jgi:enoyl-CoA hydratase
MTPKNLIVEKHDPGITVVKVSRPKALNALNTETLHEMRDVFAAEAKDEKTRVLILTGDGEKSFIAGADIAEMAGKTGGEGIDFAQLGHETTKLLELMSKPTIAAVNGFALGGGCELAMMADFIIASENAKFGQPEIKLGVAPGMGGSQRLTRAVGKAKAMDMCLTSRMMDAVEAERSGLVSRVVPLASLVEEALAAAAVIAGMPPVAAIANKEMVNAAFETTLDQGVLFERRLFQVLTATEDKAEGMAAFIEKRPGVWKGK